MALQKEAYQELEDIVGAENISEDPAILDSYAFQQSVELKRNGSKFTFRPEAVIMPASTREVQDVVKCCNRYRIKYHAYSTGWGPQAAPQLPGVIQLDLRRMDRILEIDRENMFAVIEPYVIGGTLQAEAMKVGLNTHMIGAGASASPLAAATSFQGPGPDSIFMGHSAENLLAMEWVMPTGEILRTGTLGSGIGWFCGEGPGPSVRGIARGDAGHRGASGVFTKVAIRLHPWPGPPVMPVEGSPPGYNSPLTENFRAYTLAFPDTEAYCNFVYKVWNAEIGYVAHRQFNMWGTELQAAILKIVTDPTKQLCDIEELLKSPELQKMREELRISTQFVLAGMTLRDIEYQEKALDEILAETGGWKVQGMLDPLMQKYTFLYMIKMCFKNFNFVLAGGNKTGFGQQGPPEFVMSYAEIAKKVMERHQKQGGIAATGADTMMGGLSHGAGGGNHWLEQFSIYDPHDKESIKAEKEYLADCLKTQEEEGIPYGMEQWFVPQNKQEIEAILLACGQPDMYRWQRKIKEAFNPNDVGSPLYLTLPDEKPDK